MYKRALRVLPGGVNSPVRAMRQIGREPIFIERGEGCELVDVDGNRYLDWVGSWGPLILGHAHPEVLAAIEAAAARGFSFGAPTGAEVVLAEEVAARVRLDRDAAHDQLGYRGGDEPRCGSRGRPPAARWSSSSPAPTTATPTACSPTPGSGLATLGIPASPGVTVAQTAETVVVGWNDRSAVEAALEELSVAALLAEPVAANMGVVPAEPGFLEFLREASAAAGTLLIFDEVITGFRVAAGGGSGPVRRRARSHPAWQGARRRAAGRRHRRPPRVDGATGALRARSTRPEPSRAIHSPSPPGLRPWGSWTPPAYERLGELTDRLAEGFAELSVGRPLSGRRGSGPDYPLFQSGPDPRFRHGPRL